MKPPQPLPDTPTDTPINPVAAPGPTASGTDAIPSAWRNAAIRITPGFESTGDPYAAVEGDFDGMGISCGVLQWNIGQGSLQPMVRAAGKDHVMAAMPRHGAKMWSACTAGGDQALAMVKAWQKQARLDPAVRKELVALMTSAAMRAQQDKAIDKVAWAALDLARDWAVAAGRAGATSREFVWFFDLVTQNGSLKGVTVADVAAVIRQRGKAGANAAVCDHLAAVSGSSGHAADAHKNAVMWRGAASGVSLELLVASWLRAAKSSAAWRHVVLNRKGTIAMGRGWVNSTRFDLSPLIG